MVEYILQPGAVVSVPELFYRHYGIDIGDGTVIHASKKKGKVVREAMSAFAEGKPVRYHGLPGTLSSEQVIERVAQLIGEPYRLMSDNCEHLVTHAHGLKRQSPQIKKVVITAVVLFAALMVARKARLI